jgi:ketosteroid isomerase-like protein
MARSSLEAFQTLWQAYGEGRLDESLDLVDPDCEITLLDEAGSLRGRDGVRAGLAAGRRAWKILRIVYDELYEDHPGCVVGSGHLSASSPAGDHLERPIAFVAEFRDGRLRRARVFRARDYAIGAAGDLRRSDQSSG